MDLEDRPAHPPTYALLDLDPGDKSSWEDVLVLARLHRTAFEHLELRAYPKVTGRRGVQIWMPIRRGPTFDDTRAWVEQLSRTVAAVVPELVSWKWEVKARGGGCAGLRADLVGRARRSAAASGRLHGPGRRRAGTTTR